MNNEKGIYNTSIKRESISSRASKLPSKFVQSLKPSASIQNDRISTRLSHMLFKQKILEPQSPSRRESHLSITLDFLSNKNNNIISTPYLLSPDKKSFESILTKEIISTTINSNENTIDFIQSILLKLDSLSFNNSDFDFILNQIQLLINACQEQDFLSKILNLNQKLSIIKDTINTSNLSDNHGDIQVDHLTDNYSNNDNIISDLRSICNECLNILNQSPKLTIENMEGFTKELPKINKSINQLELDTTTWFRHHFVGNPYVTLIGSFNSISSDSSLLPLIEPTPSSSTKSIFSKKSDPLPKRRNSKSFMSLLNHSSQQDLLMDLDENDNHNIGIVSVIEEPLNNSENDQIQYRIIIRTKQEFQSRHIVHESTVKETLDLLESKGEMFRLDNQQENSFKKARHFISRPSSTLPTFEYPLLKSKMKKAALLSVYPNLNLNSFKELSAESTILSGLEKDLLKYDEIYMPKSYKFGLLTIKEDQTTEEAWFSNTGLSDDLQYFLNIMGHPIKLKGYTGYSAGLDTRSGESGEIAYVSKYDTFDLVFHVAPLMPEQKHDKQQVLRKKHIGNDIICIIFLESNQLFNPNAIRSKFLHIYIVVKPEIIDSKRCWRLEVIRKTNVAEFGPSLPSPPIFYDDNTLKEFLTIKLINAETAALKSDKFSIPNNKARLSLFTNHIETGLNFSLSPTRSTSTQRLKSSSVKQFILQPSLPQRPKSIHLHKSSTTRRDGPDEKEPPVPYFSRSTLLLQDIKKGIVSGSKKFKNSVSGDTHKTEIKPTLSTARPKVAIVDDPTKKRFQKKSPSDPKNHLDPKRPLEPKKTSKSLDQKKPIEPKKPLDLKRSFEPKKSLEPKKPIDSKKLTESKGTGVESKKPLDSKKLTESKGTVVESKKPLESKKLIESKGTVVESLESQNSITDEPKETVAESKKPLESKGSITDEPKEAVVESKETTEEKKPTVLDALQKKSPGTSTVDKKTVVVEPRPEKTENVTSPRLTRSSSLSRASKPLTKPTVKRTSKTPAKKASITPVKRISKTPKTSKTPVATKRLSDPRYAAKRLSDSGRLEKRIEPPVRTSSVLFAKGTSIQTKVLDRSIHQKPSRTMSTIVSDQDRKPIRTMSSLIHPTRLLNSTSNTLWR